MSCLLGIDPGLQRMGWGVITQTGGVLRYVASGVVRPAVGEPLELRLSALDAALKQICAAYQPIAAALEDTFVSVNGASTLKLGQARGAILLSLAQCGLPVANYSATQVKKALTGQGKAEKAQVALMVRHLLPGCTASQADEADALAIALCHALRAPAAFAGAAGSKALLRV